MSFCVYLEIFVLFRSLNIFMYLFHDFSRNLSRCSAGHRSPLNLVWETLSWAVSYRPCKWPYETGCTTVLMYLILFVFVKIWDRAHYVAIPDLYIHHNLILLTSCHITNTALVFTNIFIQKCLLRCRNRAKKILWKVVLNVG
jgi:hypothetical protein